MRERRHMSLFYTWILLLLAWLAGSLAMVIWPDPEPTRQALFSEPGLSFLFYPFHYLASGLLLLFFMGLVHKLWRRVTYEWRLCFLLRYFSWQVIVLTILLIAIQWRLVNFFGLPALLVVLAIVLLELFYSVLKWKKGLIIPKR